MDYIKIRNWGRWQSYRSDRGQPPWIKVHRTLLKNPKWFALSDAQKGQLVSLWLLAAERDGEIPSDPQMLKGLCGLDKIPDLDVFENNGFIEMRRQDDATAAPARRQHGAPVKLSSVKVSTEKRCRAEDPTVITVLHYLRTKTGRDFDRTDDIVKCFSRERCTVGDCMAVIDYLWEQWAGTEMQKHINTSTPFIKKNFSKYLDEAKAGPGKSIGLDSETAEQRISRLQ